jgi:hypothetical protein
MKIFLYLGTFFILIFSGCGEKSNPIDPVDDGSLIISGKILNLNLTSENKIYTLSFPNQDSSLRVETAVNLDSSFFLRIPVPSTDYLSHYTSYNRVSVINDDTIMIIDSIHIADSNMKYIRFHLYCQVKTPRLTYSLELVPQKNPSEPAKVGNYYITNYYFDTETTIQGYYKIKAIAAGSVNEIITEYNVNTKKGWNKLITKFETKETYKSIYTVSNYASEPVDWIFGGANFWFGGI